ncbi:MAG TPA: hypothetical protein VKV27_01760 [Solirubrobacteraceae bacterium]|nr:hypothetical protein [Solirubrobacteraceae bacterium]
MRRTDARTPAGTAIGEVDGRDVRIGRRWLTDFGSPCHLGLDVDEEVVDAVGEHLARWGARCAFSEPTELHEQARCALSRLLCAGRIELWPSIERLHLEALPALAGDGALFIDRDAGAALWAGATLARARGALVRPFVWRDLGRLAALVAEAGRRPGVVCLSATDPVTGEPAALAEIASLAREWDLTVYVDDTAALGVLGERSPFSASPYGIRGNGTLAHAGAGGERTVVAASLERLCGSPLAFLAWSDQAVPDGSLDAPGGRGRFTPAARRCPSATADLALAIEGLRANERRGERLRAELHALSERALGGMSPAAGAARLPVLALEPQAAAELRRRGICAGSEPDGPRSMIMITAAHTPEQVDRLAAALAELRLPFKPRSLQAE